MNRKNVSEMILDVAAQFIEMVDSEEERQIHLDLACAAWNLSLLSKKEMAKQYNEYLISMGRFITDEKSIKYFEIDLLGLIDAKIDLYPNESNPIVSAKIKNINSSQYSVTAAFAKEDVIH